MAEKEYISEITQRTARPRSKRLRELGAASPSGSGGGSTVVISGGGGVATGDGHTHANKRYLDQLSTDTDDYLYITQYKDPTEGDEEAMVKTTEKVRAGQADEATHAQKAHDLDPDSPANDRYLRKDQDDRTEHSLGVGGSLSVDGEAHIGADATIGGTATVEGDSNVMGNASVDGSQTVVGDSSVGGDQTVNGNHTVEGSSLIKGLLSLLTGAASTDFLSGFLGAGFELRKDEATGRWRLEVDELMVRVVATFFELVIHKLRHVGGSIVLTPASMQCLRVEEI